MDIWKACEDNITNQFLSGRLVRVVESQEQIATNNLVETLDEQYLLEAMLEHNKPYNKALAEDLHYLLATPFRYPPLKYGSRFGKKSEPSLFYGSLQLSTALTETAYYRFIFWLGMTTPPVSQKFVTQHTVFGASYRTTKGLRLQEPPFAGYQDLVCNPSSYTVSQQLGGAARTFGTQALEFASARGEGINIALFTPQALPEKVPAFQQQWLCETTAVEVAFYSAVDHNFYQFKEEQFRVNGLFPTPPI